MSYYLNKFFHSNGQIHLIDGITLYANKQMVQVDHLVVHENGFVIVESKSVADRILIKDDGQWIREFQGRQSGVRSPLIQAEIQAKELTSHLKRFERLFGSRIGSGLLLSHFDVVVAVSDSGIIEYPTSGRIENVLKADLVPGYIDNLIKFERHQYIENKMKLELAAQRHAYLIYCNRVSKFVKNRCLPDDCDDEELELWKDALSDFFDFPEHPLYLDKSEYFYYFYAPSIFMQAYREIIKEVEGVVLDYWRKVRLELAVKPPVAPPLKRSSAK